MFQIFDGGVSMVATLPALFYISWRFLAAVRERRKIMAEMREVSSSVQQARENIEYIRDQVARALEEIKVDVAQELRITDRLTSESSKVSAALQRFSEVEANLIELVRMDKNMESVRIETPDDVHEEIRRIIAMIENKRREEQERSQDGMDRTGAASATRNPISKFSACGPRDPAYDRPRMLTTPEVRLLGDSTRSEANK
ncbi:uncharacterized protein LOC144475073 [Augochlora pura]